MYCEQFSPNVFKCKHNSMRKKYMRTAAKWKFSHNSFSNSWTFLSKESFYLFFSFLRMDDDEVKPNGQMNEHCVIWIIKRFRWNVFACDIRLDPNVEYFNSKRPLNHGFFKTLIIIRVIQSMEMCVSSTIQPFLSFLITNRGAASLNSSRP